MVLFRERRGIEGRMRLFCVDWSVILHWIEVERTVGW
jgi:hypothetical protein